MKIFFWPNPQLQFFSTEPAQLAYVGVGTSHSQAGSMEKIEAVDLAKNNFINYFCLNNL